MELNAMLNDRAGTLAAGQTPSPACVLRLPNELYGPILSHLCNRDLKSLRLSCRFFHGIAHLRLDRVFLSANPRNIEVLRAVADSEAYRHGVTELIWDDARLKGQRSLYSDEQFEDSFSQDSEEDDEAPGCPSWFAEECRDNVDELHSRKGDDVDRPEHIARAQQVAAQLSLTECWTHYQELLRQQSGVFESSADEAAFRHALDRFPSLKRVTVTPATHGWLFTPLYETPMIRALPHGFNYPIPRGWPTAAAGDAPPHAAAWEENSEEYRSLWRGVRIALRVLSEESTPHKVTELIFDAHHLSTGLNCHIFDDPPTNQEYAHLSAILRRPGFSRLDLALLVGGQEGEHWSSLRSGHLRRALSGAPDLTHVSLRTNVEKDPDARAQVRGSGGNVQHHVPLRQVLPVETWSRLRHFGLSGFLVRQDDVLGLLAALPSTLRSVELSFLHFLDDSGNYKALLQDMRDTLGWRERGRPEDRPRVTIAHELLNPSCGRAVWVDREVDEFLYADGKNPFGREGDGFAPNLIWEGRAGREKDAFDPSYERPYIGHFALMDAGILKKPAWLGSAGSSQR